MKVVYKKIIRPKIKTPAECWDDVVNQLKEESDQKKRQKVHHRVEKYDDPTEVIPTSMRLKIDGRYVISYKKIDDNANAYDFHFYIADDKFISEVMDDIVDIMIKQSDHCGIKWVEKARQLVDSSTDIFDDTVIRVYFGIESIW